MHSRLGAGADDYDYVDVYVDVVVVVDVVHPWHTKETP
jgi:hypothetical protein